jgi:hypothetical protein
MHFGSNLIGGHDLSDLIALRLKHVDSVCSMIKQESIPLFAFLQGFLNFLAPGYFQGKFFIGLPEFSGTLFYASFEIVLRLPQRGLPLFADNFHCRKISQQRQRVDV